MRYGAVALALSLALGCGGRHSVSIGTKAFAEQAILGRVLQSVIEAAGLSARVRSCGDTFACHQALREGSIDILVEYSGTAQLYAGGRRDVAASDESLRAAYEPLGLVWMTPLGFDNGYRLVVTERRALENNLVSIADLASLAGPLRIACPKAYVKRPGDGFGPLIHRHGFSATPLVEDDPRARLDALFDGRADAAVVYGTDGVLQTASLATLEDGLHFFPSYTAALLVRREALRAHATLEKALHSLAGRIDDKTMRGLNYQAQVEGRSPQSVAYRFIVKEHLGGGAKSVQHAADLPIAVAGKDRLAASLRRAVRAARGAFPERPVTIDKVDDPAAEVALGEAKLALLGAERFFLRARGHRVRLRRDPRVEAVAVAGRRLVHLLRRSGGSESALSGRVGIEPLRSGGGLVGAAWLAAVGRKPAERASLPQLLDDLRHGKLDAALVFAAAGDAELTRALDSGKVQLLSLNGTAVREALPFLRAARLPPKTYPNQALPIDTFAAQVLIAGLSHATSSRGIASGPAAALPAQAEPLSSSEVDALAKSSGITETPDLFLPTPWTASLRSVSGASTRSSWQQVLDTLLNVVTLAFVVWLIILWRRRDAGLHVELKSEAEP